MRKLVSIRTITAIEAIPNADAIVLATIDDGWRVVVKKGEFDVGDEVVYHEIDCFLPVNNPAYSFLAERNTVRNFEGVTGVRLRTIKLRGVYSQGLIVGIDQLPEVKAAIDKAKLRAAKKLLVDDIAGSS